MARTTQTVVYLNTQAIPSHKFHFVNTNQPSIFGNTCAVTANRPGKISRSNWTHNPPMIIIIFRGSTALVDLGLLSTKVAPSHSVQRTTLVKTPRDEESAVTETSAWQHTTITRDRHPCPGGIRTHKPSQRADTDLSHGAVIGTGNDDITNRNKSVVIQISRVTCLKSQSGPMLSTSKALKKVTIIPLQHPLKNMLVS